MPRIALRCPTMACAAWLLCSPSAAVADTPDAPLDVDVLVDLDDALSEREAAAVLAALPPSFGARPNSDAWSQTHLARLHVRAHEVTTWMPRLAGLPGVRHVALDRRFRALAAPDDPLFPAQWHLRAAGVPDAWDRACGQGVVVAVVDTGVACHGARGVSGTPVDRDAVSCVPGWNFVTDREDASDDHGHGTHVAGTVAEATGNAFGAAGLAPCARIMPVKVLNLFGFGTLGDIADGIVWAARHGAQVINLSLGGEGRTPILDDAVAAATRSGAFVVVAAGNDAGPVNSPANAPGAFAVAALARDGGLAPFSSRGPEIALAAPGVDVLQQTVCDDPAAPSCPRFEAWSGTSMAAPHVAAAAALLVSTGVTEPRALGRILAAGAHAGPVSLGAGAVDAARSVVRAQTEQFALRLASLAVLVAWIRARIRRARQHPVAAVPWLLAALVTGVGFPWIVDALPSLLPWARPLTRPLTHATELLGGRAHAWLPLENALLPLGLVGLVGAVRALQPLVSGVSLGVAASLVAEILLGHHRAPVPFPLAAAWWTVHAAVCLWIARIHAARTGVS